MNPNKQATINRLATANAATRWDLEMRRTARLARGEFFDAVEPVAQSPRFITKTHTPPQPPPQSWPTDTPIEILADEIGVVTGKMEREFKQGLAELRDRIAVIEARLTR